MTTHTKQQQCDQKPNLVLIGFRGTGKTQVGARVAQFLGRPLVDLDQVLVQEAGRSIAEIVAQEGWGAFRQREKDLVARYAAGRGQVLATGGGVILDPENVQALREHGVVIWLTADAATIRERLCQDQPTDENRPSLTGTDTLNEIEEVLRVRLPLYQAAAHLVIDTRGRTVAEVADLVLEAVAAESDPVTSNQ
jgi:shikimate kinase